MEKGKVFTRRAILVSTYFGGPFVSGYLLAQNFKLFGEEEKSRKTILYSIIFFIVFFELLFMIPDPIMSKIPNFIFPAFYSWIASLIIASYQEEKIEQFIEEGGDKESVWKIAGISVIGLVITVGYIVLRSSFLAPFDGDVKQFGQLEHSIYFDSEISTTEVDKLGQALIEYGYFGEEVQQAVNLKINEDRYNLYIFVSRDWWENKDVLESMNYLENYLSAKIMSLPVSIIMIDETVKGRIEKEVSSLSP